MAPRDRRPAGDRVPRALSRCHRTGVLREPAGRHRGRWGRVVPPGDRGDRPGVGIGLRGRHDPGGGRRPADDRRHGGDPRRCRSGPATGDGGVPGRRTSRGGADLLVCRPALPARVEDRGRGRPRTDRVRPVDAHRRYVLLRRDRPGPRGQPPAGTSTRRSRPCSSARDGRADRRRRASRRRSPEGERSPGPARRAGRGHAARGRADPRHQRAAARPDPGRARRRTATLARPPAQRPAAVDHRSARGGRGARSPIATRTWP